MKRRGKRAYGQKSKKKERLRKEKKLRNVFYTRLLVLPFTTPFFSFRLSFAKIKKLQNKLLSSCHYFLPHSSHSLRLSHSSCKLRSLTFVLVNPLVNEHP